MLLTESSTQIVQFDILLLFFSNNHIIHKNDICHGKELVSSKRLNTACRSIFHALTMFNVNSKLFKRAIDLPTLARSASRIPHLTKKRALGFVTALAIPGAIFYGYNRRKSGQTIKAAYHVDPSVHLKELQSDLAGRQEQWMVTGTILNGGGMKSVFGHLTLYQYCSCPFCCKVRAYLDYHGVDYDFVEVDPLSKSTMTWSHYKKVPVLVLENDELPLNDSSLIMSVLEAKRRNPTLNFASLVQQFPLYIQKFKNGKRKYTYSDIYQLPFTRKGAQSDLEIYWREWVDKSLVPTIGLSVYSSLSNSLDAFRYFASTGDWPKTLGSQTRSSFVVYSGAVAMWIVSKLRQRRKDAIDPKQVFEQLCDRLKESNYGFISEHSAPSLADLSAFGVLKSIEGCRTFSKLIEQDEVLLY
ncbi:hypothetical protein ACOME3_006863 [Neoechinorhynchus agilis]